MSAGTMEMVDLDALLSGDLNCTMEHVDSECSIEVTHMAIDCTTRHRPVCAIGAANILKRMTWVNPGVTCVHCLKPGRDCWRVVPV